MLRLVEAGWAKSGWLKLGNAHVQASFRLIFNCGSLSKIILQHLLVELSASVLDMLAIICNSAINDTGYIVFTNALPNWLNVPLFQSKGFTVL